MKTPTRISTLLPITLLLLPATPCLAHPEFIPRDLAAEAAGDLSAAAGAILVMAIAVFFALDKTIDFLVHQRRFYLGYWPAKVVSSVAAAGFACVVWYCGVSVPYAARAAAATVHVDKPAHGGVIQAIGDNHFEAVLGADRSVTLYVEGITTTIPFPIAESTLWAKIPEGVGGAASASGASVMLHATPQAGESKGQSSVFAGELPVGAPSHPQELTMDIPVGAKKQSVTFRFGAAGTAAPDTAGPQRPTHDTSATVVVATPVTPEQKKLFLTPGGAYTAADIAANGNMTPEQKFGGQMANHHLNPAKGAIICPITLTQANPKFPWFVGGKRYLFCCPPCVAEFVKQAKENPSGLKAPETYVQK